MSLVKDQVVRRRVGGGLLEPPGYVPGVLIVLRVVHNIARCIISRGSLLMGGLEKLEMAKCF